METQPSITVRLTHAYGQTRIYPACEKAKLFCDIAGSTTLTDRAIRAIKALGYIVNVVQEQPAQL
jgi:hypothetical protein